MHHHAEKTWNQLPKMTSVWGEICTQSSCVFKLIGFACIDKFWVQRQWRVRSSTERQTSNSDVAIAETWCKGRCCWLSAAGHHDRSLPQTEEKAINDRGTSNHIAEGLKLTFSEASAVAKDVQNFGKCLQAGVREQG